MWMCVILFVCMLISDLNAYCGRLGELLIAAFESLAKKRIGIGSLMAGLPADRVS